MTTSNSIAPLIEIKDLCVRFQMPDHHVDAVQHVSLKVYPGERVAIVGESGAIRSDYSPSEDDDVLVQGIAGDENALGFFGLAYYEANKDKLKLVAVNGVKPNMETVKTGTYAPLSRPLFIYVSKQSTVKPEVASFVRFYLKNAGGVAKTVGYVPLPASDYEESLKKFEDFTTSK